MMKKLIALSIPMLLIIGLAHPAQAQAPPNLIRNGNFEERGDQEHGWPGWHTYIMGFMDEPVRGEDGKVIRHNYFCGCGHNTGEKQPHVGFICPACKRYCFPEYTGGKYNNNQNHVSLVRGRTGMAVHMNIPQNVGASEGVRVISDLVRVRRDWPYEFYFDLLKTGESAVRVFVEGFKLPDEILNNREMTEEEKLPYLQRSYRMHIHADAPTNRIRSLGGGWTLFGRTFMPPYKTARAHMYKIDYLQVKLYGYMTGTATFDNVVLRPLSPRDAQAWVSQNIRQKEHVQEWIQQHSGR